MQCDYLRLIENGESFAMTFALRSRYDMTTCTLVRCTLASWLGRGQLLIICLFASLGALTSFHAQAADLDEARELFYSGQYGKCIEMTRAEVERGVWNEGWSVLLMKALMVQGEYSEAAAVYAKVAEKFSASIPLRVTGAEALRFSGKQAEARKLISDIPALLQASPWRFSDRDNMIALGNYFLGEGEDPREVLEVFFDRTLKSDPKFVDAHIAIAELAISKNDYQEAVKSLKQAEKLNPKDPKIHYLLAQAWGPSDGEKAIEALNKALELNPRHAESLLKKCELLLDEENWTEADKVIDEVLVTHPSQPKAWALRAVIKHMQGEYKEEGKCRGKALENWPQNPTVDYEIGRKLSRFYRFADAVEYLRRAVSLDPRFIPAQFQLAQDLLRIGATDEGWMMVDQVSQADKYNVVAANLRTLRQRLMEFTTLEAPGFIIRMDTREAKIYGERVIQLLGEARETLTKKYDHKLDEPITVEIFPKQSDFAIRTFGLPGGAGFLGVCFGKLITANSPASQGDSPSNWESVLWHEYCHVVTLQKTKNRMPRWLSEGISVYEELERNPGWGQSLNPTYREMLLGDDFVPLSKLSSAFMQPKSPLHLQFAYFESSIAVRYLVERHGIERLKRLLVDLGLGVPMLAALEQSYGKTEALDKDFHEYTIELANKLFKTEPDEEEKLPNRLALPELETFVEEHPKHYTAARTLAGRYIQQENWDAAQTLLDKLDEWWNADAESGGVLEQLAFVQRKREQLEDETKTLKRIVALSSDHVPAISRLIEISRNAKDWRAVAQYADQLLAVQPLLSLGHEALAEAATHLNKPQMAANAYAALLELEPIDPAVLHVKLAELEIELKHYDSARHHLLVTLEETPRYRAAQKLLLQIAGHTDAESASNEPTAARTLALPDLDGKPPEPTRGK